MNSQGSTDEPNENTRPPGPTAQNRAPTPRWVKIFAAIALIVAVLFVLLHLLGGHGPANHFGRQPPLHGGSEHGDATLAASAPHPR